MNKKGQSVTEIVVLIGFAAAALFVLLHYIGRAYQGNTRDKADQLSEWQYAPGHTRVDNWQQKYSSSSTNQLSQTPITYGNLNEVNTALVNKLKDIEKKKKEIEKLKALWEETCYKEALKGAAEVRAGDLNWKAPADGLAKVTADREKAYKELEDLNKEADDLDKEWQKRKKEGNKTGETYNRSDERGWSYDWKKIDEEVDSYR